MSSADTYAAYRLRMVEEQLVTRGIHDPATLKAMQTVPRHRFVEEALTWRAHDDYPLPIGSGQTISQPYIVARMTEALAIEPDHRVLEIGTGSGYQAAILSRLCFRVYTVERIDSLLSQARRIFDRLHYHNIASRLDDGTLGWAEQAPFDRIIVTAGGPQIPNSLLNQLTDTGRLVMPVGDKEMQVLQLVEKKNGSTLTTTLEQVRFVDLIGSNGWSH